MEDGGIAHTESVFMFEKMLFAVFERLFQLEPFGLVETDVEEDVVWLAPCFHCHERSNQMNELRE